MTVSVRSPETSPTRAEAGLPERGFVFCCFNNNFKITAPVFEVWMRLLSNVGGACCGCCADNDAAAANLKREARGRGVDPARLVFANRIDQPQHLARHRLADLFLDTLPYNAHSTCSDALWAGLPVLTCTGKSFAGRVAASLLHAVGLSGTRYREPHRLCGTRAMACRGSEPARRNPQAPHGKPAQLPAVRYRPLAPAHRGGL